MPEPEGEVDLPCGDRLFVCTPEFSTRRWFRRYRSGDGLAEPEYDVGPAKVGTLNSIEEIGRELVCLMVVEDIEVSSFEPDCCIKGAAVGESNAGEKGGPVKKFLLELVIFVNV